MAGADAVSIVIPALNEEATLPGTLDAVARHAPGAEVVVVDAGSADATARVAREHASRPIVLTYDMPLTRGAALNAGAVEARGSILWFLHADTRPGPDHLDAVISTLQDPAVVGGAFEFGFAERGWRLRVVEWINRARYRLRKRFYGDQGIFVRREAFDAVGRFEERGLMEDAHLCRDLRRLGRLRIARPVLRTSGRRFLAGGPFTVLWLDVRIWWTDGTGGDAERFSAQYRAENLRGSDPAGPKGTAPRTPG